MQFDIVEIHSKIHRQLLVYDFYQRIYLNIHCHKVQFADLY